MRFEGRKQYPEHAELVEAHLISYFGEENMQVFHEIPTFDMHLDVYHIRPEGAEFALLMTAGMSAMAMNVSEIPEDADSYKFAELMVMIPRDIDFGKMYPSGTQHDWLMGMIKQVARFPHFEDTWIGVGHTIQSEADLLPYSKDTDYCGCIVLPSMSFPDEFKEVESSSGTINIYGLFPLYKEEIEYKIRYGFNDFIQFLIEDDTQEMIDLNRDNFCA